MCAVLGTPIMMGVRSRCGFAGALVPALRRVRGVRVTVGDHGTRAEVFGIGHRFPAVVPVSMALATELVMAGAPLTMCYECDDEQQAVRS